MNKGLVIGKFMPPHLGHLRLLDFAEKRCDKLVIAVCSRPDEPINGILRYHWMKELLKTKRNIKVVWVRADLPQDNISSRHASKVWSAYLLKRFGRVDKIFSSEKYGDYLAEYMQANHVTYDQRREITGISATKIRNNPFKYWDYIPDIIRPYYVKKICIYGPESTGKSTLSKQLAKHFNTVSIPEYARNYLGNRGNNFSYRDIINIAKGQLESEEQSLKNANKYLFCDTDFITTSIYSNNYLGKCPALVYKLANQKRYDLYLFLDIDIGWVKDNLRDLGERREEFRKIFLGELEKRNLSYVIIKGGRKKRMMSALKAMNSYFKNINH